MANHTWDVIVGNVGVVYSGTSGFDARKLYNQYVGISAQGVGRAGNESVTLMRDGDIHLEHIGLQDIDSEETDYEI